MSEPETSKQTVYGTWEEADEIPYYPNVFERIWNLIKNMFTRRKYGANIKVKRTRC